MKYLFLDDVRMPGDVTWTGIGTGKPFHESRGAPWAIVRSFDEAVAWVTENGFPEVISFDHDLGYEEYGLVNGIVKIVYEKEEKSGYDFAKWLIEHDMDTHTMPDNFSFTVHSMNPIGTANIKAILNNYIKQKKG